MQKDLRFTDLSEINNVIEKCFYTDKTAAKMLHSPLNNYMGFNKLYGGNVKKDGSIYWEYDLPLNDGGILRLRGLNSTLVSNALDNEGFNKLILGEKQVQLPADNNQITYLTLCHHPTDWLKDKDMIEPYLNDRALLQLFGHKHNQCIQKINNSLRIVAGATHPDRADSSWLPRYNFLSISVLEENGTRKLLVKVYSRVWSTDPPRFKADFYSGGSIFRKFELDLPIWDLRYKKTDGTGLSTKEENTLNNNAVSSESTNEGIKIENPYRKLVSCQASSDG